MEVSDLLALRNLNDPVTPVAVSQAVCGDQGVQNPSILNGPTAPLAPEKNIRQPKTFSFFTAAALLLLTLVLVVTTGTYLGRKYFWKDADLERMKIQLAYYQQLVKQKPDDPNQWVNLGYSYYQLGNYEEAVKNYNVAMKLDPGFYPAYLNLGYAYYKLSRYDDALDAFQEAAKLNPNDYKAHLNMGIVFTDLDMYNQAFEAFDRAFKLNRNAADIHYYTGRLLEKTGDYESAKGAYQEALKYDPLYKEAREALVRLK